MEKNIGRMDQIIRIVLGLLIVTYGALEQTLWGLVGFVPLITALVSRCPLYPLFKISTYDKKEFDDEY